MILKIRNREVHIYKFHILILVITIIKVFLMCVCSSDYQNKLFIPFLSFFISEKSNPYQHFFEIGITNAFPYPVIMLAVECIGAVIVEVCGFSSVYVLNFFYKLPSLFFDYIGLYWLVRMFPDRKKYAAVFYFSSPIIIYAVYMHGQLDLIPTVFLLGAIYYLSSKLDYRYIKGMVLLACAVLSKLHILAVLPVIFFYLYKKDGIKQMIKVVLGTAFLTTIGLMMFMSDGFKNIVLFNVEQNVLTQVYFKLSTVEMYIPVVAVLFVYLVTYSINIINRELFVNLCGIVFIVLIAVCPPMPGWYVWIVPYMSLIHIY